MATKSFAKEDKNLGDVSIISARSANYSDVDLSFDTKTSGDVYKKTHAAAVKQAVKNLIMTNFYEKPFEPFFGGDISGLLFELVGDDISDEAKENIISAIEYYEPRAKIIDVVVNGQPERNSISARVEFQVVNTEEIVILETAISRLR